MRQIEDTQSARHLGPTKPSGERTKAVQTLHGYEIASRSRRAAAMLVDFCIAAIVSSMLIGLALAGDAGGPAPLPAAATMAIGFLCFYHVLTWTVFSATPGKMLLRLKVVDRNGWGIGISQAASRCLGYGISTLIFGLGFAWIYIDRHRRGWHDIIASTYVIYEGSGETRSRDMAADLLHDLSTGPPLVRTTSAVQEINSREQSQAIDAGDRDRRPTESVDIGRDSIAPNKRPSIGGYPVASFPRRLLAIAFDFLISLSATVLILAILVLPPVNKPPPGSQLDAYIKHDTFRTFAIVALVISYIVYPIISNWFFKGTAGKRLLHLQIVDFKGRHVGLGWILIRRAAYILSAGVLPLAIAWIAFDRKSQGWHDKIARTYVTYTGDGRINDRRTARRPRTTGKGQLRSDWPTE